MQFFSEKPLQPHQSPTGCPISPATDIPEPLCFFQVLFPIVSLLVWESAKMSKTVETGCLYCFPTGHAALLLLERNEKAYREKPVKRRVSKSDLKHLKKSLDSLLSFVQTVITVVHHLHSACEIAPNNFRAALRPSVSRGIRIQITMEFQGKFKQILRGGLELYDLQ